MPLSIQVVPIALEQRRRAQSQADQLVGGPFHTAQFVDVTGTGEGIAQIEFPISFIERPSVSFGWEMATNQLLIRDHYPTFSAAVYNWKIGYRRDNGGRYWNGCTVLVVITGPDSQATTLHSSLHAQFEGRAVRFSPGDS